MAASKGVPPSPVANDAARPDSPEDRLEIVYQDARYVAIHKPSGLLVHRSPVDRRETRFAVQLLRDQIGQRVYPVHRLDRPTSGLLLFGLDPEAMTAMKRALQERSVAKCYLAVTRGHPPESGRIDYPLRRFIDAQAQRTSEQTQDAITDFIRLRISELPYPTDRYATSRFALLRLNPLTGRRHQLRRHLSHLSYPIVGDTRYGDNKVNKATRVRHGIHRLLLAATGLAFEHPFTKEPLRIECPLEPSFTAALQALDLVALPTD